MAYSPKPDGQQPTTAPTSEFAQTSFGPSEMEGSAVPSATDQVLFSDIGISVLLSRLKQSVTSARDFAAFLKKRSSIEEDHAQGLKKLARTTLEAVQRQQDNRQGSYSASLQEVTRTHERLADNGIQFALSLHQMHEDLNELTNTMERGRKHWKAEGLNNEKKVKDAEALMDKAKVRYNTLAEKYDRARTGEAGGKFGIKGPKSAAQHEQELLKQVQNADSEYQGKVQAAQGARSENLNSARPQAIKALQDLIQESDQALVLQLQKFAAFNEKLLVGNGMTVAPVKSEDGDAIQKSSMRDLVSGIDNEKDFHSFVTSHTSSVPPRAPEIKYEKHPVLGPSQPETTAPASAPITSTISSQPPQLSQPPTSFGLINQPRPSSSGPGGQPPGSQSGRGDSIQSQSFRGPPSGQYQQPPSSQQGYPQSSGPTNGPYSATTPSYNQRHASPQGPYAQGQPVYSSSQPPSSAGGPNGAYSSPPPPSQQRPPSSSTHSHSGPTGAKPVFGLTLDALFQRDDNAVPMVVYQCIQAVDLFGLEVEGIYRLSGNQTHINALKTAFDNSLDPSDPSLDFRNPASFYHDINSVAGLLKQFFREMPEPLVTKENYEPFIEAGKIEDDTMRRDTLHAVINNLPDPNYATMRALVLHLHRVQERSEKNRMSSMNLAICFAPSIMGPHQGANIADSGLQARVVDTILQNTFDIFDDD